MTPRCLTLVLATTLCALPALAQQGAEPASQPAQHPMHHPGGHGAGHGAAHGAGHGAGHDAAGDPHAGHVPGHRFDDVERWKKVFDDPARDAWQQPDAIVRALKLAPGSRAADVGAGTGYFTWRLAAAVGDAGAVYATDVEPNMVEHLRSESARLGLPQVVPVIARFDDPTLPPGSVDLVIIVDTVHHFGDVVDWLRRLRAAMRPGGRLVVVDFAKRPTPVGPPVEHRIAEPELIRLAGQAGWRSLGRVVDLPHQYALAFAVAGGKK